MTLQATRPISLANVLAELQVATPSRAYPISLGATDVRALAGPAFATGAISLGDLLGKSSYIAMTATSLDGAGSYSDYYAAGTATGNPKVVASSGSGGYTYAWSFTTQPSGFTLAQSTLAQCGVSKNISQHLATGTATAVLQCVITDSTGHTLTKTGINCVLSWDNTP